MTMKPPPPSPHENGSATPRTPAAVTAASTAFPPRFSASIAACVASVSTLAAAPPVAAAAPGPGGAGRGRWAGRRDGGGGHADQHEEREDERRSNAQPAHAFPLSNWKPGPT